MPCRKGLGESPQRSGMVLQGRKSKGCCDTYYNENLFMMSVNYYCVSGCVRTLYGCELYMCAAWQKSPESHSCNLNS